jgi:hypothetical protein
MSLSEQFNIGARIKSKTAMAVQVTQTSNTAATTQDGLTIDRQESGLNQYYSAKAIVCGQFLYGASSAHTCILTGLNFQHSSDGTSWDSYSTATVPSAVTLGATSAGNSAGTTAGTANNEIEQSVNLVGARRYVRVQLPAPTFSDCSSGSVLTVAGVLVFGGSDTLPAA